ncbi:MAG: hypothetical protein L6Q57_04065, partial [Alphaproteobacteria bacterium]|nr:hypothetical protein [Alphaproteobacteria bacterium]
MTQRFTHNISIYVFMIAVIAAGLTILINLQSETFHFLSYETVLFVGGITALVLLSLLNIILLQIQ